MRDEREATLREAAEPVLERIRGDQVGLKIQLRAMLDLIAERLFDPQLTAGRILKAAGIRDNSLPGQFHLAVGLPPRAYMEECRLETAARLLVTATHLTVGEIGGLVGFPSLQSFSQAFARWARERPKHLRQRWQRLRAEGRALPDLALLRCSWWQRLEEDEVEPEEAEMLANALEKAYGHEPARRRPMASDETLEEQEARVAETVWEMLRELSGEEAAEEVRAWAPCFKTPAFVSRLLEAARLEGRRDRRRGVRIGECAVEAAVPLAASMSSGQLMLVLIDASARLANQRRQAGDLDGARLGFAEIRELMEALPVPADLEARVCCFEGHLARGDQDFHRMLVLAERSLALAEEGGKVETVVHALLARGMACWGLHDLAGAAESMQAASALVGDCDDLFLALATEQHLARLSVLRGRASEARSSLQRARRLAERLGLAHQTWPHLDWVEALILKLDSQDHRAEELLRRARGAFSAGGDRAHMAIVSVELALLLEALGRFDELCLLLLETMPTLESLRLGKEGRAALLLLRRALAGQEIRREVLSRLRDQLYQQAPCDPALSPSDRSDRRTHPPR